jgi:hypothetical protein
MFFVLKQQGGTVQKETLYSEMPEIFIYSLGPCCPLDVNCPDAVEFAKEKDFFASLCS